MSEQHLQVIIIGAGISGLTAAWQLNKFGIKTLVLEANHTPGGRMQSIHVDDAIIDDGAQFLSSTYTIIPQLIKETGLSNEFVSTNESVGLIRNNDIAIIHLRNPLSLIAQHVLTISSLLRLGFNQFKLSFKQRLLPLNDISAWTQYDNQLANDWVIKNFGEGVANELTASILNGFYFQSLNHSSATLAAAVIAFSSYHPKTMTLTTGIGSLPEKLAEKLNVKTNVTVSAVTETESGVNIISDQGEFNAEHAIVTVPAPIAKHIIQHSDKESSYLFETPYSSSIIISLLTKDNWLPPANIAKVYGFLVNPHLDSKIAALTIENNKCPTRKKQGYLINVMLADIWAKQLLQTTDEEIYKKIQTDVEKIFPAIFSHIDNKKIFRWEFAMPCTPMGRANTVKAYRNTRNPNNRIWLAGDYLGFPWTDSAAETGLWAANQVLRLYK